NNQLDYAQELNVIKEYYDEFIGKSAKLKNTYKIKPLLIRSSVTLGMIAIIYFQPIKIDMSLRSSLMVVTGILGGALTTCTVNDTKLTDPLCILYALYAKIFRCPTCVHGLLN